MGVRKPSKVLRGAGRGLAEQGASIRLGRQFQFRRRRRRVATLARGAHA